MNLLASFRHVIALPGESLGETDQIEHQIKVKPGTYPVYVPAYRIPHGQRETVEHAVQEMLQEGVIEPLLSPWNVPLFLDSRKNRGRRPVIDFRKVNKVTELVRYPLPVLKDLLQNLGGGNTLFSSLDLISVYWQVRLHKDSQPITAFSIPPGHNHFKRMTFGLRNALLTFQRLN